MSQPRAIGQAMREAANRLAAAGNADPVKDARLLMADALGVAADRVALLRDTPLPDAVSRVFEAHVTARVASQPVAQILGHRQFWGRSFRVTRDTLDPRPETEGLIAAALAEPFGRVLDLGTGSGCILLSCLADNSQASGLGTDISEPALAVARENAESLGLTGRAGFRRADWWQGVEGRFDLIVSNPPYISADEMPGLSDDVRLWEPHLALTPGGDGLSPYRAIAADALAHLLPGGRVLVEIGPTQAAAVTELFRSAGLTGISVIADFDGRDRIVGARAG